MRLRSSSVAIVAVLLGALVLAAPAAAARPERATGRAADRALLAELAPGVRVSRDPATGRVRSVSGGRRAIATARMLGGPRDATEAAGAFLGRYGGLYDIAAPGRQLQVTGVQRAGPGGRTVRYRQVMGGVPVLGGDLVVVVDGRLGVRAVRGETTRDATVDLRARISPSRAMVIARAAVERATGVSAASLRAGPPTRWIYDPRLMDGPGLPYARLVWRTRVQDVAGGVDQFVAVDARTGDVPVRFDQLRAGAPPADATQRICDQAGKRENVLDRYPCKAADAMPVPFVGTGAVEAQKVAAATEATFDFYARRFGYDLPADLNASATLISTIRYCPKAAGGDCPYLNAFWDGSQMVYGTGFGLADDVVAHELTHAVTERASNLFYYMQSGAINEGLSDIFGEAVDLTDTIGPDTAGDQWKIGEDLPSSIGVLRNLKDPTLLGHPDSVDSPLWDDDPFETDGGGIHSNSSVANKAFYLMVDGSAKLDTHHDIAMDQAVAIWYLAASRLLTTASDYADLSDALQIACDQLAGDANGVRDGSGATSTPIEVSDCANDGPVREAIATTHMSRETRTIPEAPAPKCSDPDATPTPLFHDAISETGSKWLFDAAGSNRRWSVWDAYGFRDPDAADPEEPTWHLFGADLGRAGDRRMRQKTGVAIPSSGRPVFLWFRHAFGFDDGSQDLDPNDRHYDGGVVEVSANGGDFRDIGPLFVAGGYSTPLHKGDQNPLEGRRAFGAESGGYTAARALLDGVPGLSFTGTSAQVSFRIGTDNSFGGEGWFIDDVWIYTCVNAAESDPPVLSDLRANLRTGTLAADGRVPGSVSLDIEGDGATRSLATVAVGPGPEVLFGGALLHGNPTGTFMASTQLQHLAVAVTDENGDQATITGDTRVGRAEQTSATFTGTWSTKSGSAFSGGSARSASTKGRKATFVAHDARQIAPVFTTGPDRGFAKVCVDGATCRTLDLYSPTLKVRRILSVWTYPGAADRTVTVTVSGKRRPASSGTRVELDALVTLGG